MAYMPYLIEGPNSKIVKNPSPVVAKSDDFNHLYPIGRPALLCELLFKCVCIYVCVFRFLRMRGDVSEKYFLCVCLVDER